MYCLGLDMTPLVLTISLGFHSFFEGMALGLIPDMPVLIDLIIGTSIHQFVASLSLGISFTKKKN
jgi:zinc transporter ZupT